MRTITVTKQISLVIGVEDYINVGLRQSDIMHRLESIDGVWMVAKDCINRNVVVHIRNGDDSYVNGIVFDIQCALDDMLGLY